MQIIVKPDGNARCLYGEQIDLRCLGKLAITRGSHVEATPDGQWTVDLSPVGGPLQGPFATRRNALQSEERWLETRWLPVAS
ncbi:hypothetical protein DTL21_00035 [Bremerella cremea]|uniref:Uncharacterized protein n=1 Tax=Blastopirellula marina TaxID=124 RepID=A0A2S8G7C8_9BACT|nr:MULTISPECIES: hypothetical protein [Pirellulaceae]PQO40366.1 hypothetical protein C5Y83_00035 [Blastopirellula marina]RCS51948.1 hypothetical protein DTL21_00035 [Bremerella cremea]